MMFIGRNQQKLILSFMIICSGNIVMSAAKYYQKTRHVVEEKPIQRGFYADKIQNEKFLVADHTDSELSDSDASDTKTSSLMSERSQSKPKRVEFMRSDIDLLEPEIVTKRFSIPPTPTMYIENQSNQTIEISITLRVPFRQDGYDASDSASYESMTHHIILTPGEKRSVDMNDNSRLYSILIKSDNLNPVGRRYAFNKRFVQNFRSLNVGEKSYAHEIVVKDTALTVDKFSRSTQETLCNVGLSL